MNVVILGAGTVGTSIADLLCQNGIHVTIIDVDPKRTQAVNEDLDVRVINGNASESSVLFQSGVAAADIVLAVTGLDEVNIVAASMAKAMGAKRTIARVYAPVFRDLSTFDYQKHFGIDRMLSLEQLAATAIARGIRNPQSVVVEQFAHGEMEVLEFLVTEKCKITQKPIRDLKTPPNVRIGTIQRGKKTWIVTADDQIEIDDHVTVFCRRESEQELKNLFKQRRQKKRRVIIGGGGETGFHLARILENENFSVTLMESREDRCNYLANILKQVNVIHADATHREVLEEERVGNADVYVACLGSDENNIVSCVEAKEIGAHEVMAVIGRPDYTRIIGQLGIDLAVSQREVMAKRVMTFLNEGVVNALVRLPGSQIQVAEIDIAEGAPATAKKLKELQLPGRCLIAAIINDEFVRIPDGNDQMLPGEKAILLAEEEVFYNALAFFKTKSSK